jgi:hypothetical protein
VDLSPSERSRAKSSLDLRPSTEADPFAQPLIPSSVSHHNSSAKFRVKRPHAHERSDSRVSIVKRKPPPPAPEIEVHPSDITPESVRLRRRRFQFDFSVEDGSPPAIGRLSTSASSINSASRARSRSASTSEVDDGSPSKGRSQFARRSLIHCSF